MLRDRAYVNMPGEKQTHKTTFRGKRKKRSRSELTGRFQKEKAAAAAEMSKDIRRYL